MIKSVFLLLVRFHIVLSRDSLFSHWDGKSHYCLIDIYDWNFSPMIGPAFLTRLFYIFGSLFQERGLDCGMRVAATQERIQPHAKKLE
jgi:hypothetical protein